MPTPTLWLNAEAIDKMSVEVKSAHPYETGGMLLGWLNPHLNEIVVADMTGPGPNAVHRRTSFTPDGEWQEHQLASAYARSDGRVTFLGDWHVHPEGGLALSRRDRRTMAKIARHVEARCPEPVTVLLVPSANGLNIGAWRWRQRRSPLAGGTPDELTVKEWVARPGDLPWAT